MYIIERDTYGTQTHCYEKSVQEKQNNSYNYNTSYIVPKMLIILAQEQYHQNQSES